MEHWWDDYVEKPLKHTPRCKFKTQPLGLLLHTKRSCSCYCTDVSSIFYLHLLCGHAVILLHLSQTVFHLLDLFSASRCPDCLTISLWFGSHWIHQDREKGTGMN